MSALFSGSIVLADFASTPKPSFARVGANDYKPNVFLPLAPNADFSGDAKAVAKWLASKGFSEADFPMLKSRNEVWAHWNFRFENFGHQDYFNLRGGLNRYIDIKKRPDILRGESLEPVAVADKNTYPDAATASLKQAKALAQYLAKNSRNANLVKRDSALLERLEKVCDGSKECFYASRAVARDLLMRGSEASSLGDMLFVSHGLYEGSVRALSWSKDDFGGHFVTQFFGYNSIRGGGIFKIKNFADPSAKPEIVNILKNSVVQNGRWKGRKLDFGSFNTPDVSWDGKKIAFAFSANAEHKMNLFSQNTCWHIFTVDADGENLVQLTDGAFEDFDPCFLPDGRIAFCSTRRGGYIRCFGSYITVPNYTMFSMKPDGTDIAPMSYFETAEWNPVVNRQGMLTFSRWDYVDRENCLGGRFWISNPDGTNPRAPHGNYPLPYTSDDAGIADMRKRFPDLPLTGYGSRLGTPYEELSIRQIPDSEKYVFTAAPHHGSYSGSLCILDLSVPDDGRNSQIKRITPDEPFPETEYRARLFFKYATPWPLSERVYVANCWENLVVLDAFGNTELLCDIRETGKNIDDRFRLLEPMPLAARDKPAEFPMSRARDGDDSKPATISVMNVYHSDVPLPKGVKIKWLRVIQNVLKENPPMGVPMIGYERENTPRIPLGIVPVEDDGSVYFEAPVAKELIFQLLDSDKKAVRSMRSVAFVFPREQMSCYGCHESRNEIPTMRSTPKALRRAPSKLVSETEKIEPISYIRHIDKILRKSKLPMIDAKKSAGENYAALKEYCAWYSGGMSCNILGEYCGTHGGSRNLPDKFGARASKLDKMLSDPSMRGSVSDSELALVRLWLDCNCPRIGGFFDEKTSLRGGLVPTTLDFDPANPSGVETRGAKLKRNFWHENTYGPHRLIASSHVRDSVFIADESGKIEWEYKIRHPQNVQVRKNGNILIAYARGAREITPDGKTVWDYPVQSPCEVPTIHEIEDGKVLVGIVGQCRLVELKDGVETASVKVSTTVARAHEQFRLCTKTKRGTYIVPFTAEGAIREYDASGKVVRTFPNGVSPLCAVELDNGNILITYKDKIVEYGERSNAVYWSVDFTQIPDIYFGRLAGVMRKSNGNTVVCNWAAKNAYGKRGAHLFEITPDKRVVWEVLDDSFKMVPDCVLLDKDNRPLAGVRK